MGDDVEAAPIEPLAIGALAEETTLVEKYDGLSMRTKWTVLIIAVLATATVFAIWRNFYFHWFEVRTATGTGVYYAFWSGFGSDIGEATIVVGLVAAWRHHSCHVRGCARIGRAVPGTPYLACPRHHPGHHGFKRSVSLDEIHLAHRQARSVVVRSDAANPHFEGPRSDDD